MTIYDIDQNRITEFLPSWLEDNYNLKGSLGRLAGEGDLNFKLKTSTAEYVIKISEPFKEDTILNQNKLLLSLLEKAEDLEVPKPIANSMGKFHSKVVFDGEDLILRALSWIPGRMWSSVNPITDQMRFDLGQCCGKLTQALIGYNKSGFDRKLEWDVAQGLLIEHHLHLFDGEKLLAIKYFIDLFKKHEETYSKLRKGVVHNDANDNNIVLTEDIYNPKVIGLIDYGDAVFTQIINDVAITCAYAIMDLPNPLMAALPIVKGYHSQCPLSEEDLIHLYHCIGMRLAISVTYSALNIKAYPENTYLTISEASAWDLIYKWKDLNPEFALYCFRHACGYEAHPKAKEATRIFQKLKFEPENLFPGYQFKDLHLLDLGVDSLWIGHKEEYNDLHLFQHKIDAIHREKPLAVIAGGYMEPRPIYTASSYDRIGNNGLESRTVHLGIDFWLPAGTAVHSLFDAEVIAAVNDSGEKEYGGMVILKHKVESLEFFSLYGHLSVASATALQAGDRINAGEMIGALGDMQENGGWAPHLHFQLMLDLLDYKIDFPGVAYPSEQHIWKSLCPDPNLLFKIEGLQTKASPDQKKIIEHRAEVLGQNLSLSYNEPLHIVRGQGIYLMDYWGQKYLDTVNNVAHVGHENYEVVQAGKKQMSLLNTNTRYLHDNILELSRDLLKTLPEDLEVVYLVNSGSEANELAIRMAKAYTDSDHFLVSEVGYHGNTNAGVEVSSYKFDGKGGKGAADHIHVFPLPDIFRGKYRGPDASVKYVHEVAELISALEKKGEGPAGLIIESILSCGGQIELPEGFLKSTYELIRLAGGLCIADEVQTGIGRPGKSFWAFQLHDVVPDIVTIGKPLGNGHPIGAVACTRKVADSFANGMEYFNTFGGNPVSCAIAGRVLKIVRRDNLQQHARMVGEFLKDELRKLALDHPIIGDVRGQGLFLGIELVDKNRNPLPRQAMYLINRMKERGILMSSDGPDHNVIKIKPPMIFDKSDAEYVLAELNLVLNEDTMQNF